jgi:hypothetical protein
VKSTTRAVRPSEEMLTSEILREQQVREERGERDTGREVLPQETSIPFEIFG